MYTSLDPPALSPTSQNNRMMELKLLHHYTTTTCMTLTMASPGSNEVWRDVIPNLAFTSANFLADALLAISALHLRSQTPHDQALVRASHAYMASSLSAYSDTLQKGINASNAEAMFLTASLIAFQSTASRTFSRDEGGEGNNRNGTYTLPLAWFHSFQGVKAIVASSWQWLRNSHIVVPIIQSQPALDLNFASQGSSFFGNLLDGLEDEIIKMEPDPSTHQLTRQGYQHAVAVLNWAHKIPNTGAPMVFLATVSRRYVDLLSARRPRAIAILACFFGLLKGLDSVWWVKGLARREVLGIVSLFDPDDEEWWPRLQWPVRMALYDGDVVPPDVWGADWTAENPLLINSEDSGFLSHIELLSQMLNAMQRMPNMPKDTIAEAMYANIENQLTHESQLPRRNQVSQDNRASQEGLMQEAGIHTLPPD
jgi:hypothetical protein